LIQSLPILVEAKNERSLLTHYQKKSQRFSEDTDVQWNAQCFVLDDMHTIQLLLQLSLYKIN